MELPVSIPFGPPTAQVLRGLRIRYLLVLDLVLACLCAFAAIILRLENYNSALIYLQSGGWILIILSPAVRIPLYVYFNLYNRLWRYASTDELFGIMRAGSIAPLGIALLNFGLLPLLGAPYSRSGSVWLIEAVLSFLTLAGLRITLRFVEERQQHGTQPGNTTQRIPTLIVGAGDAGAMMLREIKRNPDLGMAVVGFVDDDSKKYNNALSGVPVLGNRKQLPDLIRQHQIKQVIIAMPTAPGKIIRQVVQTCEEANIKPRIVPRLDTMVSGKLVHHLRDVEIEDLLRREPVVTDIEAVHNLLQGKRVLVTGGGGSIGSELCRQILRCRPAELIIIGHGENSVFEIEQELNQVQKRDGSQTKLTTYIADIRMKERIFAIFRQCRPEVIFHAAAHKHVPLMEDNPSEAVTNNIFGTQNLLKAAQHFNAERFVMVSTDKAVNPTSVMGASKRGAELLVLDAARRTGKPYVAVRFGNVLGSRGSVVLTFKRQIAMGGPVTITDPEVRRFFMTIPEAVQLLLQAAVLGQGGEIFMLDMGEPVRIIVLATDLIRLSGYEVGRDIDIVFTGLRPGEKLNEELFLAGETYHTTAHPKIRIAAGAGRFVPEHLHATIASLEQAVDSANPLLLRQQLHMLVPEYQIPNRTLSPAAARLEQRLPAGLNNLIQQPSWIGSAD
jgi:FlaA1/EpsC-like NDP-sugar epimerase